MPATELMQLARQGDLGAFETRCLEYLEQGHVRLADLAEPLLHLGQNQPPERIATLGQMVLENADLAADPPAALQIARVALLADPDNAALRQTVIELYRRVHGQTPGFEKLLEASGLPAGRPARNALRMLDLCLALKPGDTLVSRVDGGIVELAEIDHESGLCTVRREGRPRTMPTPELASQFEPIDPDDFRVLRQLRPERLAVMVEEDPVAVVLGLIHAHGQWIDQETLKAELVPRYMAASNWTKWWSRTRTLLKRCPHILIEGRAPVILRYTEREHTLEDQTRSAIEQASEPTVWLDRALAYLREKRSHREPPAGELLAFICEHALAQARAARAYRPGEALAWALSLACLRRQLPLPAPRQTSSQSASGDALVAELFLSEHDPADLIRKLEDPRLWEEALDALPRIRPEDAAARIVELFPVAPAALLDRIVETGMASGLAAVVQRHVDTALADPVDYPEIVYWLWKGPKAVTGLSLPSDEELLATILMTLAALGRTLNPPPAVMKAFRQRVKAALGLRNYEKVRATLARVEKARAITIREQLARQEGLGEGVSARLLEILRELHPDLWKAPQRRLAPWEDPQVLWTTQAGLERKMQERDHLVNVTMRDNARRIGDAAALGDLSENSEYKFALEERDLLRARLAQMNHDLSFARAIEPHDVPTDHVGVGSRVRLKSLADGREKVLTFLGPFDADVERGVINYRAPLAQRLMGRRSGERVKLAIEGREIEFEVVEISSGLIDSGS